MILYKKGKIVNNFYTVGPPDFPVFLLDGSNPVIIDAGLSCFGQSYVLEIKKVLGKREPSYLLLTHSHFDHCGAVSAIKKSFPSIRILCSKQAQQVFKKPGAVKLIKALNQTVEETVESLDPGSFLSSPFEEFEVFETIDEQSIINVSKDRKIRVINTPGHTRDCLSYYIPDINALISSDALGICDQAGYIFTECLIDYDLYVESVKKMISFAPDIICLGHIFVYTARDAEKFLELTLISCEKFKTLVETTLLDVNNDISKAMKKIKKIEYDKIPKSTQHESAYLLNLESRIKAIQKSSISLKV